MTAVGRSTYGGEGWSKKDKRLTDMNSVVIVIQGQVEGSVRGINGNGNNTIK